MCEVLVSVPWQCGDRDCTTGWHLATYWMTAVGYTVDNYTDGDHEECSADELPSAEQEQQSWMRYCEHVANTATDPLGEFVIPKGADKPHRWELRLSRWIGCKKHGLRLLGARRRGRGPWLPPDQLPQAVYDYCCAYEDCRNCLGPDIPTLEALQNCPDVTNARYERGGGELRMRCNVVIDEPPRPWSEQRIKGWLRRKARQSIKRVTS